MSRRSTRLHPDVAATGSKVLISIDSDAEASEDNVNESATDEEPAKKRRKSNSKGKDTKIKRSRGRRGVLKQLTAMPLDVLFEIFGHLNPLDVLHLAQTTKALRGILMRRSATSVWKEARSNVDNFPDCPSDLTEPQYANLAFNAHCHYCMSPNVHTILWQSRIRCCRRCLPERFLEDHNGLPHWVYSMVPLVKECSGRRRVRLYDIDFINRYRLEYQEVKDDDTKVKQWEIEKAAEHKLRAAHADLCKSWHTNRSIERSCKLEDARSRRMDAIEAKLAEAGWGEEANMMRGTLELSRHPLVKQPKDLTERIWSNIKPTLIALMQDVRSRRLKEEHFDRTLKRHRTLAKLLKNYLSPRHHTEVVPQVTDVALMEPFRSIIEDTLDEDKVTTDRFAQAMTQLPRVIEDWKKLKNEELLQLMAVDSASPIGTDNLNLATTFFKCCICPEPIAYPRILAHEHATTFPIYGMRADTMSRLYTLLENQPWNDGNRITFHSAASRAASNIVGAIGLDPALATARDMDEINPIVECLSCRNSQRKVMRWRRAVLHAIAEHSALPSLPWSSLNGIDLMLAKKAEPARQHRDYSSSYGCVRCSMKSNDVALKIHISTVHNIEEVTEEDYVVHIDATLSVLPAPFNIPLAF